MNELMWYRFKTKEVGDYRPLIDMADIQMPWWCTGFGMDGDDDYAIIVCYLPRYEELEKYWDDAYDIEAKRVSEITYTDRFPKPDWL